MTEYFTDLYAAIADGTVPPRYHGEQEYYRKDGSIMLGELDVIPQVDADGKVVRILGVTRDISERRAFEEELNRLAVTDPLTGVWNRRQGERLLAADLAEARRYGPRSQCSCSTSTTSRRSTTSSGIRRETRSSSSSPSA